MLDMRDSSTGPSRVVTFSRLNSVATTTSIIPSNAKIVTASFTLRFRSENVCLLANFVLTSCPLEPGSSWEYIFRYLWAFFWISGLFGFSSMVFLRFSSILYCVFINCLSFVFQTDFCSSNYNSIIIHKKNLVCFFPVTNLLPFLSSSSYVWIWHSEY